MLPSTIDDNETYAVFADDRQGLNILLVRRDPKNPADKPTAICGMECADRASLNAAYRWFAVRRALWQSWGRQIEQDFESYARHIAELMAAEPIGAVQASIVRKATDPRVLELGELVATENGHRSEILYAHRFSTPGKRKRFFDWFYSNAGNGSPEQLIDLGVNQGTTRLAEVLERIANKEAPDLSMRLAA